MNEPRPQHNSPFAAAPHGGEPATGSEPLVERVARALLYEGYVLYPYRPSVKNHQRWTFGGIYPPAWTAAQEGSDPCFMQTQCLLEALVDDHNAVPSSDTGGAAANDRDATAAGDRSPAITDDRTPAPAKDRVTAPASVRIRIRFLHLIDRTIGELLSPADDLPVTGEPEYRLVRSLAMGARQFQAWQEAAERQVDLGQINVRHLLGAPRTKHFSFSAERAIEPLRAPGAPIAAILIRRQEAIKGKIELSAEELEKNLIRLTVRISNQTDLPSTATAGRDEALMRSFISTHTILDSPDVSFVSQTAPPEQWRGHSAGCVNIGSWPVLVGVPDERGTMLASPIIVEDYPRIAPQSPGDLFDGGEIDEILTLRIMTLTDEEKQIASDVDHRVRDLLLRTQSLGEEQIMGMHGILRPVETPSAELPRSNRSHRGFKAGDKVRLCPMGRSDVMDIVLDGKEATISSIEEDFEDRVYVSVVIDDDPGKDLGLTGQPGHRFFFGIDEIEAIPPTPVVPHDGPHAGPEVSSRAGLQAAPHPASPVASPAAPSAQSHPCTDAEAAR